MQAAGLALAILPLIISSVENYENVSACFTRFRHFAPEVNPFQLSLKTQKVIFDNECRLLLSNVVERETAESLFSDHLRSTNIDPNLASDFALQLGRCGEACYAIVEQIKQKLEEIGLEGQKLESAVNHHRNEQVRQISHVND